MEKIYIIKKSGTLEKWNPEKIRAAIRNSAIRVNYNLTQQQEDKVVEKVELFVDSIGLEQLPVMQIHSAVEGALLQVAPEVAESYMNYRNFRKMMASAVEDVLAYKRSIDFADSEKENANKDGALVAVKRALLVSYVNKMIYEKTFLTPQEFASITAGYYYIHDEDFRLDTINCCLFDIQTVLEGGFEMANIWYNEPKRVTSAFGIISDIVLSAASQQYGGFTLPEIDTVLAKYAEKSYQEYLEKYTRRGCPNPELDAEEDVLRDIEQGYQEWEMKWNTVGSSRGDYPFITITFGLDTSKWGKAISKTILRVHREGQGKKGFKKAVLFPKLVFLYHEDIHGPGKISEDVFEEGILTSAKTMYPDWLSLSGEGYIAEIYNRYGKVISPMGCRAFLSPWYERGGFTPADESDVPVFTGRFNCGAVSLNLPMILAQARELDRDFYSLLDEYLEEIRNLHKRTKKYLSKKKASINPLGFCQGGFYGGHLKLNDSIAPVLEYATWSFGITALNELQELYNGKSLVEDGQFALEVMQYINNKLAVFKEEDHMLYAVYGTPAESLCGKQVKKFRAKYGTIPKVSDREYVSNSFHCHVSEDITPIQKQDLEKRFWELFNGGKIQYVRYSLNYNLECMKSLIRRAMEMGFYEGCNLALSYCDDCGYQAVDIGDECPCCGSTNLTKIDRMNGYLAYSRIHGESRMNSAKMAEIMARKSM